MIYNGQSGIKTPLDGYKLFITDDVSEIILPETNKYVVHKFEGNWRPSDDRIRSRWCDINLEELRKFP